MLLYLFEEIISKVWIFIEIVVKAEKEDSMCFFG